MTVEKEKKVKVISNELIGPDTHLIIVSCRKKNMPGQFAELGFPGIGEAPISISSYSRKYEFIIRKVGRVSEYICNSKKGDKLFIRAPLGRGYPLKELEQNNIIIIDGGTGIAPPRGVVQYIEKHRKKFKKIKLFFGFRNPENILLQNEIKELSKKFQVTLTVDQAPEGYTGKKGFITDALKQEEISKDFKAIVCGPPIMMSKVTEILLQKGLSEENIYLSLERHMKCGMGKCGHCYVGGKYVCTDGPVFDYKTSKNLID